ncbi:MAG: ATP-binding protein [Bacteroidales bacterium]
MNRIVITGPESTGKSELTEKLAIHFGGIAVPEYARDFISALNRPYNECDVLAICRKQIEQISENRREANLVFFDTGLIITKVWLEMVFNIKPQWIDQAIKSAEIDLYLLCAPDIPWIPDPLRENGGTMREVLFELYKKNLKSYDLPYTIIEGKGEDRSRNAIFAIENKLNNRTL